MLEVRNIWKTYEGKPLLRGISFEVNPGETVCLLGPSGGGKSTLLRLIAGLEEAQEGEIWFNGQNLAGMPVHKRGFGLMFQEYALFPHRNVQQNVAFGLRMQGLPQAEIEERVRQALKMVNLQTFAARRVTDLSGGEQQRVALARALAPRPRLLMLDEPLAALDRALREQLLEDLRQMLHATGIPALYVTHDQEEAFALADRLVLMVDGQVVQSGPPAVIYACPRTPWVAHFFGQNNILAGRVIQSEPLTVETALGLFTCQSAAPGACTLGASVQILFRAGGARLAPAAGANAQLSGSQQNTICGQVEDLNFRGESYRVHLRLNEDLCFSFLLNAAAALGSSLTLRFDPQEIWVFPDDGCDRY